MEYLLLIFRKWGETETYWLINRPGLPVSPDSPLLHNTPADPILIPDLLASLTETLTSDMAVYTGYQFTNTWSTTTTTTTNDSKSIDHFVLLERYNSTRKVKPQTDPQNQNQNQNQGEAETDTETKDSRNTPHHSIPGSISWVSRDMSRINEHLSQALEICGSDLCALLVGNE
ncbi:hypothetical protein Aspvir_006875 [Aspergillus viridinutans]|uniref:Uncharacterized protein n=1 Tax=Aspergillus viridinutans TaxID=75553 RepID=A0A9P3C2I5_ASPVI|nr:uncharacterized protein Aspvir_006875 [Aspergillus viridinutans]GIK02814.1 hypothetical protein Aspvir_006875 [Aspergillus viridinutans]